MGVQISEILPKHQVDVAAFSGKIVAVDAFNWIYQFLSSIRQPDGTSLMDSKGRITSHLSGLFYRNAKLLESNIRMVYVFDGKPSELKRHATEKRKEIKEQAKQKLAEALEKGDVEEAKKYAMRTSELTSEMIEESKQLLDAMGIPYIIAEGEGEAHCAMMCKNKEVYSIASQDSDSLLFGSPSMVRNLNITGKRKVRGREIVIYPEMIHLQEVLDSLGLNIDQLIILGILTGTDYNLGGVKGIGPKKALNLVKEHKTLEKVMENVKWDFDVDPKDIFQLFKNPPYVRKEFEFKSPDAEKIREVLCDEHDFSRERVDSVIEKITSRVSQKSLDCFFK